MSTRAEIERLIQLGRPQEALALAHDAANAGEADIVFLLGLWSLYGTAPLSRDGAAALGFLERAGEAGHAPATALLAAVLANGSAGREDLARAHEIGRDLARHHRFFADQMAAIDRIAALPDPVAETLSADPDIRWFVDFLDGASCDWIVRAAAARLQPSFVVDPATGARIPNPVRNSMDASFGPADEDLVVNAINRRIAAITATDVRCGEMLHVLRYTPGQEYRLHHDALAGDANPRAWTAITYLNDGFAGGETVFPELDLTVAPHRGALLLFANTGADNRPDPRMRHAGLPVTQGEKWLATRWIRAAPFSPWNGDAVSQS